MVSFLEKGFLFSIFLFFIFLFFIYLFIYFFYFLFLFIFIIFLFLFFIFLFFIFYFLFFYFLFIFIFFIFLFLFFYFFYFLFFYFFHFLFFYFFIFHFFIFIFYFLFFIFFDDVITHPPTHPSLFFSGHPPPTPPSFFPPCLAHPSRTLADAFRRFSEDWPKMLSTNPKPGKSSSNTVARGPCVSIMRSCGLMMSSLPADDFQQPIRSRPFPKIFPKICRRFSEDALHQSEARKSVTSSSSNTVARGPEYYSQRSNKS